MMAPVQEVSLFVFSTSTRRVKAEVLGASSAKVAQRHRQFILVRGKSEGHRIIGNRHDSHAAT
jgi:hypothetical protein